MVCDIHYDSNDLDETKVDADFTERILQMSNETTNNANDSNTVSEDKSTFTSTALGYIVEHILLAAVLGYDLVHFLPKFIRIAWFDKSVVCLAVCLFISCIVGIILTWRNRRWQYVGLDVLAGLGAYVAWTFVNYLSSYRFRLMLVIAVCVAIAGMGVAVFSRKRRKSQEEDSKEEVRGKMSGFQVAWIGVALAVVTAFVFMPIPVKCTNDAEIKSTYYEKVGYDGVTGDTYEPTYVYGDEYSLDNNMETIKNIDDSIWPTLSVAEKEAALQAVAYAYANDYGIGSRIEFVFSDDSYDDKYGKYEYNADQSTVYISTECLSDSETACQAVIHQAYHIYQNELCDIYVTLTDTQRALWKFDDCAAYIRYLGGDPLLGYENEEDADVFERDAKIECEYEARYYRRSVHDYLYPNQED